MESTLSLFSSMLSLTVSLIIIFAIVLLVDYFIAAEFYKVALMKGYEQKKYLWICFFFGIVGYLLVIALPGKEKVIAKKSDYSNELPEL